MAGHDGSNGNPRPEAVAPLAPPGVEPGQIVPDITLGGSPFPPIADYGFLSDCETVALVAPSGNVEWLCLPRVDSPSVFGAILDRGAGWFRLGPDGVSVPAARRYLPGTMVLETSWATGDRVAGRPRRADDGAVAPRATSGRTRTGAPHRLRRRPRAAAHHPLRERRGQVTLDCEPAFDYGRTRRSGRTPTAATRGGLPLGRDAPGSR